MRYVGNKLVIEGEDPDIVAGLDEYIGKIAQVYLGHSDSYPHLDENERARKLQRFKELELARDDDGIAFEMSKLPYRNAMVDALLAEMKVKK